MWTCVASSVLWITKKIVPSQLSNEPWWDFSRIYAGLPSCGINVYVSAVHCLALVPWASHPLTRTETAAIYFIIIITDFSISPLLITPQTCLFDILHVTVWSIGLMFYFSDAKLRFFYFTCTKIIRKKVDKTYLICIKHAFYTNQT